MRRPLSRREFARIAAAAGVIGLLPGTSALASVRFNEDPFQLGVASGDPLADGFVIWTRLAPEPLLPEMLGSVSFEVQWEVAEDSAFARIRANGTALARPHLAHAVHVEVGGLDAGREYFYRFRIGRYESQVGRALTCPAAGATTPLKMAFSSCAHYENGFFAAYRYMAMDKPDLILNLGDYIYEDAYGGRRVRLFEKREAVTLADYRNRYAQYRTDPDLQAAHAACPWLSVWDDHEVDNDYAALTSEHEACGGETVRQAFPARRAAAYQAWYEHMPVRASRLLPGAAARIYGTLDWGATARIYQLDTRQYRSAQVCLNPPTLQRCDTEQRKKLLFTGAGGGNFADPNEPACKAALNDPERTMLGAAQEAWLDGALSASSAKWNILMQTVMFTTVMEGSHDDPRIFTDAWAGYPPARERLLASLRRHKVANPLVLTGDIHSFWVNEIKDAAGRDAAVELATSSIATNTTDKSAVLSLNPQVKFHEGKHCGYIRCELDDKRARVDVVGIGDRRDPRTERQVLATFEVTDGKSVTRRIS